MKTNMLESLTRPLLYAISVIIPMYNVEKYIAKCLDSLFAQTFQNFEVIIVDDCSTDNSVEICRNYKKKFGERLVLISTKENSGGGGYIPRNVGLNSATGEYIQFLDADDFLSDIALETLYSKAKEYDADVVYTSSHYQINQPNKIFVHRDGEEKKLIEQARENKTELIVDDIDKNLQRLLLGKIENNFYNPWTKFVRRDFLIQNRIFFPTQIRTGGDFIWTINVYCHAKRFLRLPVSLYFYRRDNTNSITQIKRKPSEQISYWISAFIDFAKNLNILRNKEKILSENTSYCRGALLYYFKWCFVCCQNARNELSDQEIYEILYNKFNNEYIPLNLLMPFFISTINSNKAICEIAKQEFFAISVIIPVYNAEKYIAECLDSLCAQTFQNFEVIVVDDCSTDNSSKIVESYAPKFNGRLTFTTMKNNTGSGALPRNKGLSFSRGEYVFFMDSDDVLKKNGLEEMYTLAKKYDADVVYCERYSSSTGIGQEFIHNIEDICHNKGKTQLPPFVDKPTFETEDMSKRVEAILRRRVWLAPWNKFIRRNLLLEHEIFFPSVRIAEDTIWTYALIFCAKKFLRVPNIVYIRRFYEDSMTGSNRTPSCQINFCLNPVLLGLKALDNFMSRHEFFQTNLSCRYAVLKKFINDMFCWSLNSAKNLTEDIIYSAIKNEFAEKLGEHDVLIPALCAALYREKITVNKVDFEFIRKFTARVDFKLVPKIGTADFNILSMSDERAESNRADWLPKNELGYFVQSYNGKMEIAIKVVTDGKFNLTLRGIWVPNPKDRSKRIPYWIDYTKFTVNGKIIFDEIVPAWHDKPYNYTLDVKADEEIKIEVEWLPHSDKRLKDQDVQISKKLEEQSVLISELRTALDAEKKIHGYDVELIRKFSDYFTARLDFKLALNGEGDFQIVSVSDEKATVRKARWLPASEIGYSVQSYVGKMEIVGKVTGSGQFNLYLKGMDIRDPKNREKRIPYWIDYTKLIVNGEVVFDKITPVWHDKSYTYTLDIKADEEIKIEVEWLPHSDKQSEEQNVQIAKELAEQKALVSELRADLDSERKSSEEQNALLSELRTALDTEKKCSEEQKALVSELRTALDTEKKSSEEQNALVSELRTALDTEKKSSDERNALVSELRTALDAEKKVHGDDVELIRKFSNYLTARLDFKFALNGEGDFQIVSVSDEKATVRKARWLPASEIGYSVQSYVGKMEIVGKVVGGGQFNLYLKGMDVRDPDNKSKRIPYWIDYTKLTVNGEVILDKPTPVWHDKSYTYTLDIKADEEIKIEVEWLPHSDKQSEEQNVQIAKELAEQKALVSELRAALDTEKKSSDEQNALVSELRAALDNEKKSADKQNALVSELRTALVSELRTALDSEKKVTGDDVDLIRKSSNDCTARLDFKFVLNGEGDFQIVSVSDEKATVRKVTRWLSANEVGYFVQSCVQKIEVIGKIIGSGQFNLNLKGKDVRDPQNKRKRIPCWIDYTKLTVNGEVIFDKITPVWHDKPFNYIFYANADEEIKIEVEWLPHK